jgi:valyl-tRNA synthetase
MIEKTYQPAEIETRMSRVWEDAGAFKAGRPERRDAKPFTIVIPPPNVTGSLHMGHALNNTLQDILCRFERMRGRDVLWQPGTDHAGIATQMVVERQLMERQEKGRRDLGRQKFLERVWEWKAESGGTITRQLKRLGASCDWSRERFTMGDRGAPDDQMVRAVMKVFVDLYNEKLIYKDKRLVNWDPALLTAISDLEVQQVEVKGNLWYLRYPIADGMTYPHPIAFDGAGNPSDWEQRDYVVVATTRPETMLGDTAVAVHPDDARYAHLVAQKAHVILPLVGRRIPIIADEYSDPEKGSGAVKITPAHDFNDFEVGKRHGLPQVGVLDAEGKITLGAILGENLPQSPELEETKKLQGIDRFKARKLIVERLDTLGLLDKVELHMHMVPHGDRSNVVIEPFLTDQWYVDAKTLAQPAIAAVRDGRTNFVPKNWEKTYFDWMENIQPWCISRQLWWGHQIPVWYGPKVDEHGLRVEDSGDKLFVAETEQAALAQARLYYGPHVEVFVSDNQVSQSQQIEPSGRWKVMQVGIGRDSDVLDTWFSSALWPFSTLGWPDDTKDVERYYPTDVLVTGFDIIFFWVARMMMMGLHFRKEVPFPTVYIHALVRDAKGAKMSKSKGNVIDPLHLIDEYGADALRFTLAAMAAQGRDIKLDTQRVAGYRNFATKLWNAARFAEINGCAIATDFDPRRVREPLNSWALNESARAAQDVTKALAGYRFNEAAEAAYRFVWNTFCDWYLELAKPVLQGVDGPAKLETQKTVAFILHEVCKILHPFMPFITEELWQITNGNSLLTTASWPARPVSANREPEEAIGWLVDLVTAIRSVRAEMNVPPATLFPLILIGASREMKGRAEHWGDVIKRLARVSEINFAMGTPKGRFNKFKQWVLERIGVADRAPEGAVQLLVRGEVAALPLKGVIDLAAEKARLDKELAKAEADIKRVETKLANEKFVANAPEDIVEEEKEKREAAAARKAKILEALERLKNAA